MSLASADIDCVFRAESGRAVASLIRDAFVTAVQRWPETGLPPSPAGLIITTARNRAIDRIRRESTRDDRQAEAVGLHAPDEPEEVGPVADHQLRLIFTCCHPPWPRPRRWP